MKKSLPKKVIVQQMLEVDEKIRLYKCLRKWAQGRQIFERKEIVIHLHLRERSSRKRKI